MEAKLREDNFLNVTRMFSFARLATGLGMIVTVAAGCVTAAVAAIEAGIRPHVASPHESVLAMLTMLLCFTTLCVVHHRLGARTAMYRSSWENTGKTALTAIITATVGLVLAPCLLFLLWRNAYYTARFDHASAPPEPARGSISYSNGIVYDFDEPYLWATLIGLPIAILLLSLLAVEYVSTRAWPLNLLCQKIPPATEGSLALTRRIFLDYFVSALTVAYLYCMFTFFGDARIQDDIGPFLGLPLALVGLATRLPIGFYTTQRATTLGCRWIKYASVAAMAVNLVLLLAVGYMTERCIKELVPGGR